MCGIAGWIGERQASPGPEVLRAMTDAVAHRGPDGAGEFVADTRDGRYRVALGHRRLAIIDLATGQQPMQIGDRAVTVIFNGEIYNFRELREELRGLGHRFATNSDTEVLLSAYVAWGPTCVRRLRGMFAFAIWDAENERLVLARDRFGKKPLYIFENGAELLFASEIKSILACPTARPDLDRESVLDYLTYRYVPGPYTLFRGVRKLPPGSYGVWEGGKLTEQTYYTPPDASEPPARKQPADPVATFLEKLDESVRIRMVSDVPFGAFLSGGIDSSTIVALMSRHSALPINTFSVGFAEAEYSELRYAKLVAEAFHTNHHELVVLAGELMDYLPRLIRSGDAPVTEPASIPIYLLSMKAAESVKMVLSGEGSDEILAGYPKHRFEPFVAPYQALVPKVLQRILVERIIQALPYGFRRVKTLVTNFGLRDPKERMPRWFGALSFRERAALTALAERSREPDPRPFAVAPGQSPLRRILYFDQTSWLPDNLLERGDRMTMAGSIETRMPFMDHELAALMSSLPDSCRIRGLQQKVVLRQAMRDILPGEILTRPKVGFRIPVNEWFRGPMRDYLYDHLTGPSSLTHDYYRPAALNKILDEHTSGRQNHEKLIWTLVNLELFQRCYGLR